jgi:hypothetical protein
MYLKNLVSVAPPPGFSSPKSKRIPVSLALGEVELSLNEFFLTGEFPNEEVCRRSE